MKPYIQISIRTKMETIDWECGGQLIESLYLSEGLLAPEFVSHNPDKVKEPFEDKAQAERLWAEKGSMRVNGSLSDFFYDFAWKRKKAIRSLGYVRHTKRNIRNQIVPGAVILNSAYNEKIDWYKIFRVWCEIFPPQLGMLHYFTEPELEPHMLNDSFQIGSFNAALKPDVPNAGWAMFYGNEFAEKVDAERIAKAGFPIENISDGYLVRVTEDIQDIVRNFRLFVQKRTELKSLFPEGFFLV
ncbi:hypothetical protein [Pseudomonas citronellolis]|uniref:hypothetical protein n=1 Tax=Pseudomonas citronellolis TaxID=53408 RepID=UPI002D76B11F|nr:hypothetical protein [Pseudomonas citronellolis]WRT85385.1 hypothetical protein VK748_13425 [Pseudomonas citronellolis]